MRTRTPKLLHDPDLWVIVLIWLIGLAMIILACAMESRGDVPEAHIHTLHLSGPLPEVQPGNTLLVSPLYVASLNPRTKFADWVRYRITPGLLDTENVLVRNWRTERKAEALEDSDYTHAGYDRGHLIPLDSVSASPYAAHVNRLDVIAPQRPDLNRGPWLKLESHVRDLARQHGAVDVTVGCLYETPQTPLPRADESHQVPSHFWMHIEYTADGDIWQEAYRLPQTAGRDSSPEDYAVDPQELPPGLSTSDR